mgnify:CR=1 FL=1
MNLSVKIKDITFKNPVIVTSGEHGRDAETIIKAASTGVAAITTKSIISSPIPDPLPCYAKIPCGFLNCVLATTITAEQWFKTEIPMAKKAGIPIIVNIAGTFPKETSDLAKKAVDAGADIIELPTYCPHLAENLEAQFPGMKIPPPEIDNPKPFRETVKAVRQAVNVPIIGKLSAVFSNNSVKWVKAGMNAGMDVIEITDTFGPAMSIDIETGQPKLGGPRGFGAMSGGVLKPIALRMVFEVAQKLNIPIIASGGISTWKDAVEYIMAGASMVGVCTVGHLKGKNIYSKIISDLEKYFEEKGISIEDIKGLAQRRVKEREEKNILAITEAIVPTVIEEKCTACKMCETSCIYEAITIEDVAHIDKEKCYGCGLCVDVCPVNAIKSSYYKE